MTGRAERGGIDVNMLKVLEEYLLSSAHKNWAARRRDPGWMVRAAPAAINGAEGVP